MLKILRNKYLHLNKLSVQIKKKIGVIMKISKKARQIPASMTLEITAKVNELKSMGKQIIGFTAGEPDCNTPKYIIDSCKDALDMGVTKYTAVAGTLPLRKQICEKFEKDNGLKYVPEQIVVCNGAKSALYHALYALCDDGDEVILVAPFWFTYKEQIKMCGGVPVIVNTVKENEYKITPSELENAITPRTKAIIINSPCNPTGVVYTKSELEGLAKVIEKYNIAVISDEIYEKLIYDDLKHVSIASLSEYMYENTIVINGVSKSYAMTGWRIGYLACNKELARVITKLQSQTTSNACSFAQHASVTALLGGDEIIENMRKEFDERRKLIMSLLTEIGLKFVKPKGAFYIYVNIKDYLNKQINGKLISNSLDFANILVDYGVAVIPGLPFYKDGYVRMSYAISQDDIIKGVQLLKEFLAKIK